MEAGKLLRSCGCVGVRSCLLCEKETVSAVSAASTQDKNIFTQCRCCGELFRRVFGSSRLHCAAKEDGANTTTKGIIFAPQLEIAGGLVFDGVRTILNFIDEDEELALLREIDQIGWAESQSGRRKQDYGPKINFKKRKVQVGRFAGLPAYLPNLMTRIKTLVPTLTAFVTVELCCLDYCPERGSAIDPHVDDTWVWGEHLVTINLLSSTTLTFVTPTNSERHVVEVWLPRRSLVVVSDSARYYWEHSIERRHITSRRVAITLRELSADFCAGGSMYEASGKCLLQLANKISTEPTNLNRTTTLAPLTLT